MIYYLHYILQAYLLLIVLLGYIDGTIISFSIDLLRFLLTGLLVTLFISSYFISDCITLLYILVLLQCHGHIELNPDPKDLKKNSLSLCHWNLNSLPAHSFLKLTQLKVYILMYKHDLICLSETYVDSTTPDSLLEING